MVRGRAASPIRPGLFIREQLLMEGELNPAELHTRLRQLVREVNQQRPRSQRIRAATWPSFYRYLKHLQYFFLVEPTGRTEPVLLAPEELLHIVDREVVPARRAFYRLTDAGRAEPPHEAFENPVGLWKEIGYPPTPVVMPRRERAPPPPPVVPPPRRPPRRPPRPTPESLKAEANAFLPEIQRLARTVAEYRPDRRALEELVTRMGTHYDRVENALERARGPRRVELRELRDILERTEAYFLELDKALNVENWEAALRALEQVSDCCRWPLLGEVRPPPEEIPPEVAEVMEAQERWDELLRRIKGWPRPRPADAQRLLSRFLEDMGKAGVEVTDLEEAQERLEAYRDITREDFDTAEEYREARTDAWQEFLDSLDGVELEPA